MGMCLLPYELSQNYTNDKIVPKWIFYLQYVLYYTSILLSYIIVPFLAKLQIVLIEEKQNNLHYTCKERLFKTCDKLIEDLKNNKLLKLIIVITVVLVIIILIVIISTKSFKILKIMYTPFDILNLTLILNIFSTIWFGISIGIATIYFPVEFIANANPLYSIRYNLAVVYDIYKEKKLILIPVLAIFLMKYFCI